MAVSITFDKKLDKEFENSSLKEILDAKPSALSGLTEKHDEIFAQVGIKTVRDLGSNKYIRFASALAALEDQEG